VAAHERPFAVIQWAGLCQDLRGPVCMPTAQEGSRAGRQRRGNWICWSDSLRRATGAGVVADHGGPSNRLKPLQASQLVTAGVGKSELSVVGGPVTKQAVRLRIVPSKGRPREVVPFDAGAQFPVNFYVVFFLEPAKTAWMPERVIAYDKAGRRIAECWAITGSGNACDRPQGAPQPP
jgi:hypothetical protein